MLSSRPTAPFVALTLFALVVGGPLRAAPSAQYADGPTSQWFKSLASAFAHNCCDQADCRRAMSEAC